MCARFPALRTLSLATLAVALPCMLPAQRAAAPEQWALVGGTVIPATGEPAIADGVVVISGARILAVGPRNSTPIPRGARVVDARGQYITPGPIFDMVAGCTQ